MTEEESLALLRTRVVTVQLRGKYLGRLIDCDQGPPGQFFPPVRQLKSAIRLRTGRTNRETLFTLCHEVGHFWAYATNHRTDSYDRVLPRHQDWENTITLNARNTEAMLRYMKPSEAPPEVYAKALENAERDKPNPLTEADRREILVEEVRAWCFGFEIASALGVTDGAFGAAANEALGYYYRRLKLPSVEWTPTSCKYDLTAEDRRFVAELTAPDAPRAN